jgi:AcrR family transcriptional regulator
MADFPSSARLARADRARLIEDAATRLFAHQGYASTTVEDIVRAAGVTKPMLYRHWESKQELCLALFERHREELAGAALAVFDPETSDRRRQAVAMLEAWVLVLPVSGDPEVEQLQRDIHARQRGTLAALLREVGCDLEGAEADLAAAALRGSMEAVALWWMDHPDVPRELPVGVLAREVQGLTGIPAEPTDGEPTDSGE